MAVIACVHGLPLGIPCRQCAGGSGPTPTLTPDERLENAIRVVARMEREVEDTHGKALEQSAKDAEALADMRSKLDAMEKRAITAEVAADFFKSEVKLRDRVTTQVQEATPVENVLSTYMDLGELDYSMREYGKEGYRVVAAWAHEGRLVAVYTK